MRIRRGKYRLASAENSLSIKKMVAGGPATKGAAPRGGKKLGRKARGLMDREKAHKRSGVTVLVKVICRCFFREHTVAQKRAIARFLGGKGHAGSVLKELGISEGKKSTEGEGKNRAAAGAAELKRKKNLHRIAKTLEKETSFQEKMVWEKGKKSMGEGSKGGGKVEKCTPAPA